MIVRHCLTLALAALGCAGVRARTDSPGEGRPFSISSFGGSVGIQVRMQGTIAVQDRWVYVVAPRGSVRTYQLDRQDYWDLRVRAAVASCKGRDFDVVSEGRAARVATLLGLSRDAARLDTAQRAFRDTLRLDVGLPPGTDLARSWIALIFEWPFENVMATYTMHVNLPLDASFGPWTGRAVDSQGERCR
jgi:hypothetical protein